MNITEIYSSNPFVRRPFVHENWYPMLVKPEVAMALNRATAEVKKTGPTTPDDSKVLRFLSLDPCKINVIILGQDPYKPAGVANGRAFQPANLEDWIMPFRQVSLKNMLRCIWASQNLSTVTPDNYDSIPNWGELRDLIACDRFKVAATKKWFDNLEAQGVLFLNTALTTKVGVSGAHMKIWETFTRQVIKYIIECNMDVTVFVWGNSAKEVMRPYWGVRQFESRHPMMCSKSYRDDFMYSQCFRWTAMNLGIDWSGLAKIPQ